jgi:TonB family protein
MIASWMLYASVVGLLVGAAAVSADRILRTHRLPTRWVWCAALLISIGVPVASRLLPESAPAPVVQRLGETPASGSWQLLLEAGRTVAALLDPVEPLLVRGWWLGSLLLFTLVGISVLRLRRARAAWREGRVDGTPVLVSSDVGPAVLGVFRHRIVLPAWVLARNDEARELILAHEREHVRARDPLLVVASALPSLLVPWHLPLWWQYRRLRLAVEMDCDERVLGHAAPPGLRRRYGHLLLEVGRRKSGVLALAAPFSEERSFLGRRIRRLAETPPPHPFRQAALLSALGLLLVATAWAIPSPPRSTAVTRADAPEPGRQALSQGGPPAVTGRALATSAERTALPGVGPTEPAPDDRPGDRPAAPEGAGVQLALQAPTLAHDPRTGADGPAADATARSAGVAAAEATASADPPPEVPPARGPSTAGAPARDVVRPALPLPPLVYAERVLPEVDASPLALELSESTEDEDYAAAAAGMAVRPQVLNAEEIQKQMVRRYPSHLLDAGIGGTVVLDFFVDESGVPTEWQLVQSSGHALLDDAALKMAGTFRFSPARTRWDQVVPVWTRFPIRFQVMR